MNFFFLQQMFFYFCNFNIKKTTTTQNSASKQISLLQGPGQYLKGGRQALLTRSAPPSPPIGCEVRDEGELISGAQILNSPQVKGLGKPFIKRG